VLDRARLSLKLLVPPAGDPTPDGGLGDYDFAPYAKIALPAEPRPHVLLDDDGRARITHLQEAASGQQSSPVSLDTQSSRLEPKELLPFDPAADALLDRDGSALSSHSLDTPAKIYQLSKTSP